MGGKHVRRSHLGCVAAIAAFFASTALAAGKCQLQQLGTLPVDMQSGSPLIQTKINGVKAWFSLDTGEFYSTMSRDAASRYHLAVTSPMNGSLNLEGMAGSETAYITTVAKFEFLGIPLPKVQFIVLNGSAGSDVAGQIGQNLLRVTDVEFDLANGAVRFFKPVGCNDMALAYWARSTPYSFVKLGSMSVQQSQLRADATINGHRMTTWFATGTARSMLSLDAAERAGIRPDSPGVKFLGVSNIEGRPLKVWVAPVDSFQIGGEKVTHTHLLIMEYDPTVSEAFPDLMLGSDFFLSHRIYVAYSQNKLYFTYNGGPLFNLNLPGYATAAATIGATAQANATTSSQSMSSDPADAAGFRRRGMAYAAMREFDRALADLTRACELAPHDTANLLERGVIYDKAGQFKSALKDFDAVSRLALPAANIRLQLSVDYGEIGDYSAALTQVDQWLDNHQLVDEQAVGLNERCFLRASANRDLHAALDDCNRALSLRPDSAGAEAGSLIMRAPGPKNPDFLGIRGLVYLRLGDLKAAMDDYNAALRVNPNMATALYGRGLAELRESRKTQGEADIAAAEKLSSGVAKRFASMGLAP
jgi:tetratricopeptide (TPR) repeat protein/predicted aspartyl protease